MIDRSQATGISSILRGLPPRPLSETGYHYSGADDSLGGLLSHDASYARDDIDMPDAGPTTAPPRPRTFLHDD